MSSWPINIILTLPRHFHLIGYHDGLKGHSHHGYYFNQRQPSFYDIQLVRTAYD